MADSVAVFVRQEEQAGLERVEKPARLGEKKIDGQVGSEHGPFGSEDTDDGLQKRDRVGLRPVRMAEPEARELDADIIGERQPFERGCPVA